MKRRPVLASLLVLTIAFVGYKAYAANEQRTRREHDETAARVAGIAAVNRQLEAVDRQLVAVVNRQGVDETANRDLLVKLLCSGSSLALSSIDTSKIAPTEPFLAATIALVAQEQRATLIADARILGVSPQALCTKGAP